MQSVGKADPTAYWNIIPKVAAWVAFRESLRHLKKKKTTLNLNHARFSSFFFLNHSRHLVLFRSINQSKPCTESPLFSPPFFKLLAEQLHCETAQSGTEASYSLIWEDGSWKRENILEMYLVMSATQFDMLPNRMEVYIKKKQPNYCSLVDH